MPGLSLLVDIGNTRAHFALSGPSTWRRWDIPHSEIEARPDCVREALPGEHLYAIGVSSVSDPGLARILAVLERASTHLVIFRDHRELPLPGMRVRTPETVGMDRLMNVLGARAQCVGAQVVVDFGTALTLSAMDAQGVFLGGAIAPGRTLMALALHRGTSALPEVGVGHPAPVIGCDTSEAIAAGVWHGVTGVARELVRGALATPALASANVWATGGDAQRFAPAVPEIVRIDPDLTLKGIRHALEWQLSR